eukprot:TRINITY_DN1337_c0_g1_i4.p1 TRINITY_DN1337_c0_g1~~TRINITY_DN1337_c0_g1_i4.p1  ORF type:complete len:1759 (+),score=318.71 TRINITY_DN1337_c0_g1_i4:667-5943(+)
MPALEQYGASPCIELLRQLVDKKGFYDRAKFFWKHIEDTTLICAGGQPGGGRNKLTPRFIRHFNVFYLPQPSNKNLQKIFGQICSQFLMSYNFNDATRKMWEPLVLGTIDVYNTVANELKPIPSKFHYTFNLRDISKVFQGILQVKPQSCNNPESISRLWIHETLRVFSDRLVNQEDEVWFQKLIGDVISKQFKLGWNTDELFKEQVLFTDITKMDQGVVLYEEILDKKKLIKTIEDKQDDYNFNSQDKLDLVFFQQAIWHILRVTRILRQPRGNAMLIGVGGSGKQSLSKLSSFIMKCSVNQIELTKNYKQENFREDLAKMMRRAGVERQPVSFIFTDVQIAYESFLEDINNLLNSGEIPNLYSKKEDLDDILNNVRQICIKLKKPENPEAIWNFFVEQVRENMHTILCMSPVGDTLRVRCRKFPSIVNCCTLDWFSAWPKDALLSVAHKFIDDVDLQTDKIKESLITMCMTVAVDVADQCEVYYKELKRRVYTTPKSYLDQIFLYKKLLEIKRTSINQIKRKLSEGLEKLQSTNDTVATLKIEMEQLKPQLEEQSVLTEKQMKQVSIDQQEANEVEKVVSEETQKVNIQTQDVKQIADEAQAELAQALPALKEAEDALNTINKADIAQIKGYSKPPDGVLMVLEAVCILLQEKSDWASAKTVMIDIGFIDRLKTYEKNNIPDGVLRKLRAQTGKAEFDPAYIGKQSMACKSLCMWCKAIDNYAKIYKSVAPKKKRVAELQQQVDIKRRELEQKEQELQKVKDRVTQLQAECEKTIQLKNKLEKDIEQTKNRLIAAEKLTDLLADEGIRWKDQISKIDSDIQQIIGNVFLAATTISYLGSFSILYRDPLVKKWYSELLSGNVPMSENYTLADTLEIPINIRDWNLQGLPNDNFSIENAVISQYCERWPLFIDPQGQANNWLKNHYKNLDLKILNFSDQHYIKTIQVAIASGFPVLIEGAGDRLEPSIDSVLQKQIFEEDGRKLIRIADKKIDYNPKFRFYLTTKMANPHYLPEIFIKVTVINFSITFEGLQDQLLSDVMKNEKPEIEMKRDQTIISIASAKRQVKEAQDKILDLLAEAKGMILDDVELIQTLESSKQKSAQIATELEESQQIEAEINESRNLYTSVAIRGTILYFVIQDLSGIDPMYQYSLNYFKRLFKQAMETCEKSNVLDERLMLLNENITKVMFLQICRGLFESHKKLYSFLICCNIKRQSTEITPQTWNLLIRGHSLSTKEIEEAEPMPETQLFNKNSWNTIIQLSLINKQFSELPKAIKRDWKEWEQYITTENIYQGKIPSSFDVINPIFKLILIKALRFEKIMESFSFYVADQLGKFYEQPQATSMEAVISDSQCISPIIFILSQGADPTSTLLKYGKEKDQQIQVISLGQGQGKKAEVLLQKAQGAGTWVLLQNCHLAKSWMPSLEKIVEQFPEENYISNQNFRLFLTSMPVDYFPVSVLQNGLKLTTEAPRGLKSNLKKSYSDLSQNFYDSLEFNQDIWKKLIFGLAFFHAIVQERRKFGPLGFNIRYEFNDSDLDISTLTLKMFVNDQSRDLPWEAMLYMTGHINYGGRVTDDWDRTCLLSILKKYYCTEFLEDVHKITENGVYVVPKLDSIDTIKQYIDTLPNFDEPDVFGMHENANITFQNQESSKMIETILSIQPRVSQGGAGKSSDEIVLQVCQELSTILPAILSKESGNPELFKLTKLGSYESLTTVLLQEVEKFNKLLTVCSESLGQLQKAIKGFVVMSQDLDDMYLSLIHI